MSLRVPSWFGRVFGDSENPLLWSVPLGRVLGSAIRVHVVFPVIAALWLVRSISPDHRGAIFELWRIGAVLLAVAVHEFGRIAMARLLRSRCDEIVAWPLGGLIHRTDPDRGTVVAAAFGAPAALLVLLMITSALLVGVTGSVEGVLVNPFEFARQERLVLVEGVLPWAVWMLHAVTAVILLMNLALPVLPMDSGWVARAVLAKLVGDRSSWRFVARLGLVVAAILAGFGWVIEETVLIGVAVVVAFVSWQEQRRQQFLAVADMVDFVESVGDDDGDWRTAGRHDDDPEAETAAGSVEIDLILEKISATGIASLSKQERRALDRASQAHRQRID